MKLASKILLLVVVAFLAANATDTRRPSVKQRSGLYMAKIADTVSAAGSNTVTIYADTGTSDKGINASNLTGDSICAQVWGFGDSAACKIIISVSESPNGSAYYSVKLDTISCGVSVAGKTSVVAKRPGSVYRIRLTPVASFKLQGVRIFGNKTE